MPCIQYEIAQRVAARAQEGAERGDQCQLASHKQETPPPYLRAGQRVEEKCRLRRRRIDGHEVGVVYERVFGAAK